MQMLVGKNYTETDPKTQGEMIANFVGDVLFAEDNSLERFVNELTEEKKKTFGDFIRDFINWIKGIFGKTDEVRMLEKKYAELFGSERKIESKKTIDKNNEAEYNKNNFPIYDTLENRKPTEPLNFEAIKQIREQSVKKFGLNEKQASSLNSYVMGLAYLINRKLNSKTINDSDRQYVKSLTDALNKFPVFAGRTFRNLKFKNEQQYNDFLKINSKGNVVSLKAFTSTSKMPNGYPLFGKYVVHMVFDGVGGRDIADTYGLPRQQEVLYLPDTKYKVDSVSIANDGNPIIFVKEIATNEVQLSNGDNNSGRVESGRGTKRTGTVYQEQGNDTVRVFGDGRGAENVRVRGRDEIRNPVNLPDPDDSSYSYTPTKAERIAALVDQFEEKLIGKNKDDPISNARLTEEDATTTPDIKRKTGEVKGDGERDTVISKGRADIFSEEFKKEVETDDFIQKYKTITNEETLRTAADELDREGEDYLLFFYKKLLIFLLICDIIIVEM